MGNKAAAPVFAAAILVAAAAFLLYRSTLLPGFDLGDTPSFQVMGGEPVITPRDGYPLYFAIGRLFTLFIADRAYAMNLASAAEGAVASGLIVVVGTELSGSVGAATAAALLFTGSYTFWSQSIIAEVYALHAGFMALSLWLLLRWDRRPTLTHLAAFFLVYAAGFGNHLSMILLAPAYTAFLLASAPEGWRSMFKARVVLLAALCAALGALQYAWNLRALWLRPGAPPGLVQALQTFWFDVTKSDWRDTMVMHIPSALYRDRLRMYLFDVREQFSLLGPLLAAFGAWRLVGRAPRRASLLLIAFLVNFAFAFSYNVGDSHVFYLPAHLLMALLMAPALVWIGGFLPRREMVVAFAILFAGYRIYHDYPALDRSGDRRPEDLLRTMTTGLDDRRAILVEDVNWQIENGLTYFTRQVRPDLAVARAADVMLYAPALIADNLAIDRVTALTSRARSMLDRAYGPLFRVARDDRIAIPSLTDIAGSLPEGTRYAITVLRPVREWRVDEEDLQAAIGILSGGRVRSIDESGYAAMAGVVGRPPALLVPSAPDPFSTQFVVDGVPVTVRMDSWLNSDTIRRMGFGHVIAGRRHTLIVERGVSFAAFDAAGRPLRTAYAAGLFAPDSRFIVQGMLSLR